MLKENSSFKKVWSSLGKGDQQLVMDRVTGNITQLSDMTIAMSSRQNDIDVDPNGSFVDKANDVVSNAVNKFMSYTWIDTATSMQSNAVLIEKTPLYIKGILFPDENSSKFFREDANMTKSELGVLEELRTKANETDLLDQEMLESGYELFSPDEILKFDLSARPATVKSVVNKLKSKQNAELRTSVTQMTKGDQLLWGDSTMAQSIGMIMSTFKPTIMKQTADNWHILNKTYDRMGLEGAAKISAIYLAQGFLISAVLDQLFSTILDEKSGIETALEGNSWDAFYKVFDKYSPFPLATDVASTYSRWDTRQGYGSVIQNQVGPIGQRAEEVFRAGKSKNKIKDGLIGLGNLAGLSGLTSSNILLKFVMRQLKSGDIKLNKKGKGAGMLFKERAKQHRSKLRRLFIKE